MFSIYHYIMYQFMCTWSGVLHSGLLIGCWRAVHMHIIMCLQNSLFIGCWGGQPFATVLCKSNANDNRRISRFVLVISRWYISDKLHGLADAKTTNQRDIGTIFAICRQDISLARICCNDTLQGETI